MSVRYSCQAILIHKKGLCENLGLLLTLMRSDVTCIDRCCLKNGDWPLLAVKFKLVRVKKVGNVRD